MGTIYTPGEEDQNVEEEGRKIVLPENAGKLTTDLPRSSRRDFHRWGIAAGLGIALGPFLGKEADAEEEKDDEDKFIIFNGTEISVRKRQRKKWKDEWEQKFGIVKDLEERRKRKEAFEEHRKNIPIGQYLKSYFAVAFWAQSKDHNGGRYIFSYPSDHGSFDLGKEGGKVTDYTFGYAFTVTQNSDDKEEKMSPLWYVVRTSPALVTPENPDGIGYARAFKKMEDAIEVCKPATVEKTAARSR